MRTVWVKIRENLVFLILLGILAVYFAAICLINFSGRPSFYNTDMYTDIMFAAEAWKHRSLIPEGWLFGNQLYVVATPAIAALYCGVTENPQIAMAMAAVTLTVLILLSFDWMLKPVLKNREDRLLAIVFFMTMSLFFGDSVGTENGWQLFFTMCAYYACYVVNVFLAFGCYIRADDRNWRGFWPVLLVTCALSFCTGMQSLRQTAVMSVPLAAVAGLRLLWAIWKKQEWKCRSLLAAVLISAANVMGLLYKETFDLRQTEIFGDLAVDRSAGVLSSLGESVQNLLALMAGETVSATVLTVAILLVLGLAAAELWKRERTEAGSKAAVLAVLLAFSVLSIGVIDLLTTIFVRQIYYFMFYPLAGFLVAYGFSRRKAILRVVLLGVFVFSMVMPSMLALKDICMMAYFGRYDNSYEISDYLLEHDYRTVYALWNQGAPIAVASEFEIQVGYWDKEIFTPVDYLCNPDVFEADSDQCVYAFYSDIYVEWAKNRAAEKNIEITQLHYFPDIGIHLYTAPVNLMQEFK